MGDIEVRFIKHRIYRKHFILYKKAYFKGYKIFYMLENILHYFMQILYPKKKNNFKITHYFFISPVNVKKNNTNNLNCY